MSRPQLRADDHIIIGNGVEILTIPMVAVAANSRCLMFFSRQAHATKQMQLHLDL